MKSPIAIAVTGSIGAGKSEVLAAFADCGAAVIQSDDIVHKLLKRPDIKEAILKHFGKGVVSPHAEIDRSALAQIVFNDHVELRWLEELLHPLVRHEYMAWREQLSKLPEPPSVCVTEIPLLYETQSEKNFDYVIVITAPEKLRQARAQHLIDQRDRRMMEDSEKISRADYTYTNGGTIDELNMFVESVMNDLKSLERVPVKING